jgi:DNA invertase Pin-like site-specific DNA recombinase
MILKCPLDNDHDKPYYVCMRKVLTLEMEAFVLLRNSESVSSRQIARELGVNASVISTCLQNHGLRGANNSKLVSPQQLADLIALAKEGATYNEIMEATGLRRKTIDKCLRENGVSKPLKKALTICRSGIKSSEFSISFKRAPA